MASLQNRLVRINILDRKIPLRNTLDRKIHDPCRIATQTASERQ